MVANGASDRSLGANVLSGVSHLVGQQIAGTLLGVVSMAVLVRHLGPGDYGLWAIATGVLGLTGAAAAPFDEAIRRFVPEALARSGGRRAVQVVVLATGARIAFTFAAVLGLVLLARSLASVYPAPEVMAGLFAVGALQVLATSLDNVTFAIFLGLQRYGLGAAASVTTRLLFLGIVVAAAVADWGLATLWLAVSLGLAITSVAFLALAAALLFHTTRGGHTGSLGSWRDVWQLVWSYTWPLWGNRANGLVYQHASRTLLGAFAPPALVGLFSLARAASEHLSRLYQQLPQVLVPALAGHVPSNRGPSLTPLHQVGRWAGPLGAWLSAGVLLLAPEIVRVFAGSEFDGAVPILRIFAIQPAFRLAVGVWSVAYNLRKDTRILLRLTVARVAPVTAAVALVAVAGSAQGVAVIEASAYLLTLGLLVYDLPRRYGVPAGEVIRPVAISLPIAGAAALFGVFLDALWARAAFFALVPALTFLSGGLDRGDVRTVSQIQLPPGLPRVFRAAAVHILNPYARLRS